jgi:hypothetical protein
VHDAEACPGAQRPVTEGADGAAWGNELGGTVYGSAVQARSIHGDVHFHGRGSEPIPGPGQLLPVPPAFTNRSAELAALAVLLDPAESARPLTLAVIMGVGGVGKTSLALRWLYQVKDHFPAGQLYADLGGHVPASAVRPAEVLGRFLRAVGLPPGSVPTDLEEASGLWRSVTTGRRLIVLLDNAASAAQVRAVLPGPGPSLVAVTTRWRLGGLAIDGAHFTELGPLAEPDAIDLLGRIAGAGRVSADPDAARSVVRMCGQLPLAVCVSAARLAPNPRWPVSRMATELASERDRLTALSPDEDLSVRAVSRTGSLQQVTEKAPPPCSVRQTAYGKARH